MADTERSLSALLALLANNTVGDISAQDMRDVLVSLVAPRGSFYIATTGDVATTSIGAADSWYRIAGTTTVNPDEAIRDFSMPGNNSLQYNGPITRDILAMATISVQAANNNKDWSFGISINGAPPAVATVQRQFIANASSDRIVAMQGIIQMSQGDELGVFVRNNSDSTNITADQLQLVAVGFLD